MREFRVWNASDNKPREKILMSETIFWEGGIKPEGNPRYMDAENFALRGDGVILERRGRSDMFEPSKRENLKIEFYINRKDKHGRKIFDGDIIRQRVRRVPYNNQRKFVNKYHGYYHIHKVVECKGSPWSCRFAPTANTIEEIKAIQRPRGRETSWQCVRDNDYSDIEVVGNIHEEVREC